MPRQKKVEIEKAINPPLVSPERFRLGEMGNPGYTMYNGITDEELKRELNFPQSMYTFKEMTYHSAINSPLTLYDNIIGKLVWSFKPPVDATEEEKKRCKIIESMMTDMEQPWSEFIRDTLTSVAYGFCVNEKVFRYRKKSKGSMHDDGLIGWKKLPIRAQESIQRFTFSEDGNELTGVIQDTTRTQGGSLRFSRLSPTGLINIPRSKFMLFRSGKHRGDPYGRSPLRDAYLAWRYLTAMEEIEATGVQKDLTGFPVLHVPMNYLSSHATDQEKQTLDYFQTVVRNLQQNTQSGMILPVMFDPVTNQPLFKIELLSVDGKRGFDIDKVKTYYKNLIMTSLFGDVLVMGQTSTGSFALGAIKNSLSGSYAERIADSIVETLNTDLARMTYELNGWDTSRMGSFDYDGLDTADLDNLGKFLQRTSSVGLIEKDRAMLNLVRKAVSVDPKPDDVEPEMEYIDATSSAGQGMDTPFEGTATNAGDGTNSSDLNTENAA